MRYPLVGGTRERHFDGTSFKPRKVPENAQTPTSRVHAVLGRGLGSACQKVCCRSITGSNMSSVCWIAIIQAPSKCIQIASVMESVSVGTARCGQKTVGRHVWNVKRATPHGFHAAPRSPALARAQTSAPTRRATSTTIHHATVAIPYPRSRQATGNPPDDVTHARTLALRRATMACRGTRPYPRA